MSDHIIEYRNGTRIGWDKVILIGLAVSLILVPIRGKAAELHGYTLTVGGEQVSYVPQPEAGYVFKRSQRSTGINLMAETLPIQNGDIKPIRGGDRRGLWIVENDAPVEDNNRIIDALQVQSSTEYIAPLFSINGEPAVVIPEIVVKVRAGAEFDQSDELCRQLGLRIIKRMDYTELEYLLEVLGPDAESVFAAVRQLNEVEWIKWSAPNIAFKPRLSEAVIPNDEYFNLQWHLNNTGQTGGTPDADVNAPEAWEITTGDPNIIVAIVDSGVDLTHPDLINNLVRGYDFDDNDDDPMDENGHGTACAGLVAAQGNNEIGVTGVAPGCRIMPVRIPVGWPTPESEMANGIRWAAANGADVISNSWECFYAVPIIHSAIRDATEIGGIGRNGKGCVVLFCSGNQSGAVAYPARYPEVIAVGATDYMDIHWYYSDFGPELDVVAPSGGRMSLHLPHQHYKFLWTTDIVGYAGGSSYNVSIYPEILDYRFMGGTSGATPIAAGVAALILSVNPSLTNVEAQRILEHSARDLGTEGYDYYYGHGRVDARAAVEMALTLKGDFNFDRVVNMKDFCMFAQYWSQNEPTADIAPPPDGDGTIDFRDFCIMGLHWLEDNNP